MRRIIDDLTTHQRYAILEELLKNLNTDEQALVEFHTSKKAQEDRQSDDEQARIGREIAMKRNDPTRGSGTIGRKLI